MEYANKIYLMETLNKIVGWHCVKGEPLRKSYQRIINHCGSIEDGRRMLLAESLRYDGKIKSILLEMRAIEIEDFMASYEEILFACGSEELNDPKD